MDQLAKSKTLCVCVGDLSADQHASKLIKTLKERMPELEIWGAGGDAMRAAGADIIYETMPAIGLVEVLREIPKYWKIRRGLTELILEKKPDALLLMDFGGFNVGFATHMRSKLKDLPIIYFISPQVWGSRPWRINAIGAAVSKMLVIFPFEEPLYQKKGVNARFVGHPLSLKFKPENDRSSKEDFCKKHGLDPEKPIIGIFPGSRKQEIRCHSEVVLQAVDWLRKERPELQFVISQVNRKLADVFQDELHRLNYVGLLSSCLKTLDAEHNEDLMTHSDILWTKSGTTTLEATLIGKPMIIYYRGAWISYLLIMIFKTVKYFGLPNLLHGEGIVPELIMLDCRAERLVRYTCDWLDVPGVRAEISAGLKVLRGHLGEANFTDNAASEILTMLEHA